MSTTETAVTAKDVVAAQDAVATAATEVAALSDLITKQQELAAAQQAKAPDMAALAREREDALANIAAGNATEKDLRGIDARTQKAGEENSRQTQETQKTKGAIAGLQRRLAEAQDVHEDAKTSLRSALTFFLEHEADQADEEYLKNARKVMACYGRLRAIGQLLTNSGCGTKVVSNYGASIRLPIFNRTASRAAAHPNHPGELGEVHTYNEDRALKEETSRIREIGIEI